MAQATLIAADSKQARQRLVLFAPADKPSIEGSFLEVRRRTRPMVCFVNVKSVDRIIYSIFNRFNLEWKTRTLEVFTQAA